MRAHIIENGVVVNTIEVESLSFLPNLIDASLGGSIGDSYINGEFIKPTQPKVVPSIVTMRQARLALLDANLLDNVEQVLNLLPEPMKSEAKIDWEYAAEVRRDWPTLNQIAEYLDLTEEFIDDMFILAASK